MLNLRQPLKGNCQPPTDNITSSGLMRICVLVRVVGCDVVLFLPKELANLNARTVTLPPPEVSQAVAADWLSRPACPTTRRFAEESPGFKGQGGG